MLCEQQHALMSAWDRPLALVVILIVAAGLTACGSGSSGNDRLDQGASLGGFDHLAGGTAVPKDPRTLLNIACVDGVLRVQTDREAVVAGMDCARMIRDADVDQYRGKTVAISLNNDRLKVQRQDGGSVDFQVTNARVVGADATP